MGFCKAHALLDTVVTGIHCAEGTAELTGNAKGEAGPLAP